MKPIVYLSAEYGLSDINLPIYAGGLGVLAGDVLKEASNLKSPMVGVGVFYSRGFFTQELGKNGWQNELYPETKPESFGLKSVKNKKGERLLLEVPFPGRSIFSQIWEAEIKSYNDRNSVPLYLLDANVSANSEYDRKLTEKLYPGDWNLQLEQEVFFGLGSVKAVQVLGIKPLIWHLNDDHAAFSLLYRMSENIKEGQNWENAVDNVKKKTVFTTHTPVRGAESVFSRERIKPFLDAFFSNEVDKEEILRVGEVERNGEKLISLTVLALRLSRFSNAVSLQHQRTSRKLWHFVWPERKEEDIPINFVTNGVNGSNWVCPQMKALYSKYLGPNWEERIDDYEFWQKVYSIPNEELWQARVEAKKSLIAHLSQFRLWEGEIQPESLFIGFARRFAPYKQVNILISSFDHLKVFLVNSSFAAHLFVAGKAHPNDKEGKRMLQMIYKADHDEAVGDRIIFCENYDIALAKYLIAGVDVWLNTPLPPYEASGTSGMKALLNGVLNASTLDGWWYEAYNGENGWVIGSMDPQETAGWSLQQINDALFYLLEQEIVPLFYKRERGIPKLWINKVKKSLATSAFKFNTKRMLQDYFNKFYLKIG